MDDLTLMGLLIGLADWANPSGKRTGSIQGFNVGRRPGRRRRRR